MKIPSPLDFLWFKTKNENKVLSIVLYVGYYKELIVIIGILESEKEKQPTNFSSPAATLGIQIT